MSAAVMVLCARVGEPCCVAEIDEDLRLLVGPPVACEAGRAGPSEAFRDEKPSIGRKHPMGFGQAHVDRTPVMHGR